ncbi:RNA polymerase II subunit A C-terminal domain phosphatase [Nematocida sp. AWRm77]|nr:RNA polymerase II subunit A C-terminal domain phosphatase [Nematocida sp. AWRm77]
MDRKECMHPVRVHGMCACCGEEVPGTEEKLYTALHHNTDVQLNQTEAEKHNEASFVRLTREQRMVLLLDLDQTVIHTSTGKVFGAYYKKLCSLPGEGVSEEEKALREVQEISVDGFEYYVKKRDGLDAFLKQASKYFEIHIYTMGNRQYGNIIAEILDKDKSIFGARIVTRDDNLGCFEKDLSRIFPTNTKNVVILDDRPDVWGFSSNLFPVRPYTFFKTGDINSPELLKKEAEREAEGPGERKGEESEEEDEGEDDEEDEDGEDEREERKRSKQTEERRDRDARRDRDTQKEASILVKEIIDTCVSNVFDNELETIMKNLLEIHTEYFKTGKSVVDILKEKKHIFKGCVARFFSSSFESEKYLSALFVHYGGTIDVYVSKRTTHVIIAGGGVYLGPPPSKNIKYVNISWVHESVFSLKRLPEENFACYSDTCAYSGESEEDSDFTTESTGSLYDKIVEGD